MDEFQVEMPSLQILISKYRFISVLVCTSPLATFRIFMNDDQLIILMSSEIACRNIRKNATGMRVLIGQM